MNIEEKKIYHTEEIQDIIERMPQNTGRWIVYIVIGLTALFFVFSWSIQYPEIISCPVTIVLNKNPVKLLAKTTGMICLLKSNSMHAIKKGEIIGYVKNTAELQDVLKLDSLLETINIRRLTIHDVNLFPRKMQLGDLTPGYSALINLMTKFVYFSAYKQYRYQKSDIQLTQKTLSDDLCKIQALKKLKYNTLKHNQKLLEKDSLNFHNIHGIAESDWNKAKIQYNSSLEGYLAIEKEEMNGLNQLRIVSNRRKQLELDELNYKVTSYTDLISSYNQIRVDIKRWIDLYVFIAPINGIFEKLDFIKEFDNIQVGQELFSVIPYNHLIEGNSYLSVIGSGRVELNQRVHIKLDNYPYTEFGVVEGVVSKMSLLSEKKITSNDNNSTNAYLITIKLSQGIQTNLGASLKYRPNLKGIAEIVTNKRKFIDRLFDNLKYMIN